MALLAARRGALLLLVRAASAQPSGEAVLDPHPCAGEFSKCSDGSCTLGPCGVCKSSQYLCPDFKTCQGSPMRRAWALWPMRCCDLSISTSRRRCGGSSN